MSKAQNVSWNKELLIAMMLGSQPNAPIRVIAKSLGLSQSTVSAVKKRLGIEMKTCRDIPDVPKEVLKQCLRKTLPLEKRAEIVGKVASNYKHNQYAALKAVEMANNIDGINGQEHEGGGEAQSQPVFVLPGGTNIQIKLTPRDQRQLDERVINVTPEEPEQISGEVADE